MVLVRRGLLWSGGGVVLILRKMVYFLNYHLVRLAPTYIINVGCCFLLLFFLSVF